VPAFLDELCVAIETLLYLSLGQIEPEPLCTFKVARGIGGLARCID
jgi:hypothetical protein